MRRAIEKEKQKAIQVQQWIDMIENTPDLMSQFSLIRIKADKHGYLIVTLKPKGVPNGATQGLGLNDGVAGEDYPPTSVQPPL